jgi:hypothetical protein
MLQTFENLKQMFVKAKVTEAGKIMRLRYLRNLVKFRQNEIGYNADILIVC